LTKVARRCRCGGEKTEARWWFVCAVVAADARTVIAMMVALRRRWRGMVVEGEEKIRVRVLGDEDDDVAAFHWTAC